MSKIKILDPACGSGAFLIAAFDCLWEEQERVYNQIKELKTKSKDQELFDRDQINKTILENNLYGVDVNSESVEITKLSLWLKTAVRNKKLNNLANNIKIGNSLIEDSNFAENAFHWTKEFIEVFNRRINKLKQILKAESPINKKGGFDIVIGNPPYVRADLLGNIKSYLEKNYDCYSGTADLYTYFYERGLNLLNSDGFLGFISSNKFIRSNYGQNLRSLLAKYQILNIIDFGELPVFQDASTFPSIVIIQKTQPKKNTIFNQIKSLDFKSIKETMNSSIEILPESFQKDYWTFSNEADDLIMEKMKKIGTPLGEYVDGEIFFGIKTGFNRAFIIDEAKRNELVQKDPKSKEIILPILHGDNVRKYKIVYKNQYIILSKIGTNIKKYPAIFKHLSKYKKQLEMRKDQGNHWWELRACDYYELFDKPKILLPGFALESKFSFDKERYICNAPLYFIPHNDLYLLSLLNSKLLWFYLRKITPVLGDIDKRGRLIIRTVYLKNLPIANATKKQHKELVQKVDIMLVKNKQLLEIQNRLIELLISDLKIEKLSEKLENWFLLEWKDFLKELNKKKIDLTLKQKSEWMKHFNTEKIKASSIREIITQTDKEIDSIVYDIYNLSPKEIQIIEGEI